VRDLVLDDPAPFIPFVLTKRKKDIEYEAKAVTLAGRRYIVCRNREEMKKDAAARAAILTALERQLKKGDKSLVGNKGYRRFLATPGDGRFAIDRAKAEEDAKFDGVFVLRTNADLSWIPERSATGLREADLNVLAKLGEQGLEWRLEAEAFARREVCGEDDLLDFLFGHSVDIQVTRQPST
jgi:hypothetical protein